ncbi:hypothetical protein FHS29_004817 [Saccharothrix tamanrassetensis]|uniref:DUF1963 domain-containing protein n=1 Tax=Saccharothrix tamanrassetensis TaxID=1051531 RepID=A0A841CLN0_9PSEU|nr:DUF1963 domain-containing protein [Saccharothrix tamanrassetensis]MBB5958209.1 hypothetical protein [Saccharothrix tamanrassetensis]
MTSGMLDRLAPFREEALKRGIPATDVERWIGIARPCATLASSGDGPVVGRFGGPVLLPADASDPWFPHVATLDCAALPPEATDLALPSDGHLLLFAFPDISDSGPGSMGTAAYVPAGAAVEERARNPYFYGEIPDYHRITDAFPEGPLRLTVNVSLPYHGAVEIPEDPYLAPLPGHPHSEQLRDVWLEVCGDIATNGPLQVGGYALEECIDVDPVVSASSLLDESDGGTGAEQWGDWVLLADWYTDIRGLEGATVHWVIRREDLAAQRFDRVCTSVDWNP